ncbi:NAD(P)-dependent oxidoreductase [Actinokineospora pegani]|uniref:NAD(P)-dependent oxidoreductase n=1 Tax=Actinokineospora pegani TaxID=2654637 RepID=UPI0012EAED17|nr:NAD(P)-binding domain-containing protein [Actinokineospora pegani]
MSLRQQGSEGPGPVTVIGLGPAKAALVDVFVSAGHPTTVWSRGHDADAAPAGARRVATLAEAVRSAELVLVRLVDNGAIEEIVNVAAGVGLTGTVVNLTPGTPDEARHAADWAHDRGVAYLDGVAPGLTHASSPRDVPAFFAGPRAVFDAHTAALARMAARAVHLGEDAGLPALMEAALLDVMWSAWTGVLHALALLDAEGVAPATFVPHARKWLDQVVTPGLAGLGERVRGGVPAAGEPTLGMQVVAMDHLLATTRAAGVDHALPALIRDRADEAVLRGHANGDFTRLFEVLRHPKPQ